MKNTNNSMELVNIKKAAEICGIDAHKLSSQPAKFVKDNAELWYLVVNTWLLLIDDLSSRTRRLVQDGITRRGLLFMIQEGDAVAERIMHAHADGSDNPDLGYYFNYLVADISESVAAERSLLTVLRFAKRLSPIGANLVKQESIKKFLAINSHDREKYRVNDCPVCKQKPLITNDGIQVTTTNKERYVMDFDLDKHYLWRDIVATFRSMLPDYILKKMWKGTDLIALLESYQELHHEDGTISWRCGCKLSNGSTYEHARVFADKADCLAMHYQQAVPGCVQYPLYQNHKYLTANSVRYVSRPLKGYVYSWEPQLVNGKMTHLIPRSTKPERWEDYLIHSNNMLRIESLPNVCRIVAVPKSYKTSRIIAMEQTWRGFVLQGLRDALVSNIRTSDWHQFIDVEDQTPNQEWAWQGSIDRQYCTVDLTGASDSIDCTIGYALCPELADFWDEIRSRWLQIDKDMLRANIFLTSGTPVTFIWESMFFLSVAVACTDYVQMFEEELLKRPRTFGDDVELDSRVFDTFCDVLANLGFTVNSSKSFSGSTNYRESCGVEYLHGYPLHTVKWPRNEFKNTGSGFAPEVLSSLVSLQHKIYDLSWSAQYFLARYIGDTVQRDMTSSKPYTDGDDLWSHDPEFGVAKAPGARDRKTCEPDDPWYRERHLTLTAKSDSAPHPLDWNAEMLNYVSFLANGPRYATKLDELLHVSEPLDRSVQYCLPKHTWRTTIL